MRFDRCTGLAVLLTFLAGASGAMAQDWPEGIPTEGFWPTRLMVDRMIDRVAEEMGRHYRFDDEQLERTRELLKERVPKFMEQNRGEIQVLMNQFIEAQLAGEAPSVENVSGWAQRAMPMLERVQGLVDATAEDMRDYLTDDQVVQLDGEMAAFSTALGFANNKLGIWAEGGYDPETEWVSDRRERRRREMREQAELERQTRQAREEVMREHPLAAGEASGAPQAVAEPAPRSPTGKPTGGQATSANDEWDAYVAEFIKRYDLDENQRQKALQLLASRKSERDQQLKRRADRIAAAEKRLSEAGDDEARKAARNELDRAKAPIATLFERLKDDLDKLPTRQQRRDAAQKAADATPARGAASQPVTP